LEAKYYLEKIQGREYTVLVHIIIPRLALFADLHRMLKVSISERIGSYWVYRMAAYWEDKK
jgi:hypothetical protein